MIHARADYNRMQDPALNDPSLLGEGSTPIAEDEPVVLFRAQDKHFIAILGFYRDLTWDESRDIADSVNRHIERARQWQSVNGCKTPDLPTK